MSIHDRVLEKIKKDNIKPLSPIFFWLKRSLFWLLTLGSLVLAWFTTSLIIFLIANQDLDIYHKFTNYQFLFFFFILPYFWLTLLILFIWSLSYNYRHTKYGYRAKLSTLIIISLILIITFGYLLYTLGYGYKLENYLFQKSNFYNQTNPSRLIWSHTEKGLLAGQIIGTEKNIIRLKDLKNKEWQIVTNYSTAATGLLPGQKIKIIGQQIDHQTFFAHEIRSWCGCGGCLEANNFCANGCNH